MLTLDIYLIKPYFIVFSVCPTDDNGDQKEVNFMWAIIYLQAQPTEFLVYYTYL